MRRLSVVQRPSMGLAAAHLRANDIQHINTNAKGLEFVQRIVYGPPLLVLILFLLLYVLCIVFFALLLWSAGAACYELQGVFSFEAMLWISVHAFSTIGFGNIAPLQSCVSAQIIIMLESFISLLVVSAIGGYVVKMFMRPLSAVRFSHNVLVNGGRRRVAISDDDEGDFAPTEHASQACKAQPASMLAAARVCPRTDAPADAPADASAGSPAAAPAGAPAGVPPTKRLSFSKHDDLLGGRPSSTSSTSSADLAAMTVAAHRSATRGRSAMRRDYRRLSNSELHSHGVQFVTLRMVRQGRVQLRDVRVAMQAQYWVAGSTAFGDRDSHKGRVVNLTLEQNYFTTLEQLQVWHAINEDSPLYKMRDCLHEHLDGIEVSVSAFDTASLQHVMFFKRYEKAEVLQGFVFDNTLTASPYGRGELQADHSKLDCISREDPNEHKPRARAPTQKSALSRKTRAISRDLSDLFSGGAGKKAAAAARPPSPLPLSSSDREDASTDGAMPIRDPIRDAPKKRTRIISQTFHEGISLNFRGRHHRSGNSPSESPSNSFSKGVSMGCQQTSSALADTGPQIV